MKKYLILLVAIIFQSCSSTYMTSSWKQDAYQPKQFNKIIVLGITEKKSSRATIENALVDKLKKEGINAISSLNVFPIKLVGPPPTEEEMYQALTEKGVDGIFTISLLDIKEEQHYVQGQTYQQPVYSYRGNPTYYNSGYAFNNSNFYGYYNTMYQTVSEPGYYVNSTLIFLETNFYEVSSSSLVWTAQTETTDPNSISSGSSDYAAAVMRGLKADGVFE